MIPTKWAQGTLAPGPVLVFGGPYSNLQAAQALRAQARHLGIAPQNCICTGDVVAYGANPSETLAEIRDWGCQVIAGNVERQLAEGALDCGCGFEPGTTCDLLSAGWYAHANACVGGTDRAWMRGLPDILRLVHASGPLIALHGGASDVSRFLWPVSPATAFEQEIAALTMHTEGQVPPALVLSGHCGIPFQRSFAGTKWVNAGVIGMPPHDGAPQTRYAILEETGQAQVFALDYDFETAARAMEAAGLRQGYHQALRTGWWPSQDILPAELRRQERAITVARGA